MKRRVQLLGMSKTISESLEFQWKEECNFLLMFNSPPLLQMFQWKEECNYIYIYFKYRYQVSFQWKEECNLKVNTAYTYTVKACLNEKKSATKRGTLDFNPERPVQWKEECNTHLTTGA